MIENHLLTSQGNHYIKYIINVLEVSANKINKTPSLLMFVTSEFLFRSLIVNLGKIPTIFFFFTFELVLQQYPHTVGVCGCECVCQAVLWVGGEPRCSQGRAHKAETKCINESLISPLPLQWSMYKSAMKTQNNVSDNLQICLQWSVMFVPTDYET